MVHSLKRKNNSDSALDTCTHHTCRAVYVLLCMVSRTNPWGNTPYTACTLATMQPPCSKTYLDELDPAFLRTLTKSLGEQQKMITLPIHTNTYGMRGRICHLIYIPLEPHPLSLFEPTLNKR